MNAERLAQIERRLADLGDLTLSTKIDKRDGLQLQLDGEKTSYWWITIADHFDATATDYALLEFLGDAPHAIRDLLAYINRTEFLYMLKEGGSL